MIANTQWRLTAALFLFSASATAETIIDEIIVTADFRERTVAEIPISVTVMDERFLKATAVQHFEELVSVVPNLNWSGDGHRARYFQIRGVGELEQYQGAPNPSIGFLIDDIDFSGIGTIATVFDMQSIEVLRGSQGSRYGANALGGIIYMRSMQPSAERNGRVQLSVGGDDAISVGGAFSAAVNDTETLLFRLSGQRHQSNGFRDNSYLNRDDTNARDETTFRARLRFVAAERFEANAALLYTDIDDGYDAFSLDNGYTTLSDKPGKDSQRSIGASLRLAWNKVAAGSLTSITSIAHSDIDFSFDADWGNDSSWGEVTYDFISASRRERVTVSQEIRFATQRWLFGIYALDMQEDSLNLNQGEYYDPFYDFQDSLNNSFNSRYDSRNVAVFAQYSRSVGEATMLSVGLRIERRRTSYGDSDGLDADPSETLWGGELSIVHELGKSTTAFASLSQAYKASGFNLGAVPENVRFFDDEVLWTIEVGVKSMFFEDSLSLNTSLFQQWRSDQQVRTSFQLDRADPTSFGFATLNVAEARGSGLEAELNWIPRLNWELYANVGLLAGKFRKVGSSVGIDFLHGRAQAHAPRYTAAAGVAYRAEKGFFARVDASAKDAFYFDVSNNQRSTSYALVNVRIGYDVEIWRASLWARNLFDTDYAVRGFYFGNEPPDFPNTLYTRLGDSRQLGVTLERRF